jgi:hypothetical protein
MPLCNASGPPHGVTAPRGELHSCDLLARWAVYYADGSRWTDLDGECPEAPGWGVQCIAEHDPDVGRTITHRRDYYLRVDGEWTGVDLCGLLDNLVALGVLKVGRTIRTSRHREIYQSAVVDPYMKPKCGRLALEDSPP